MGGGQEKETEQWEGQVKETDQCEGQEKETDQWEGQVKETEQWEVTSEGDRAVGGTSEGDRSGVSVFVHMGTNNHNAEKDCTTAIFGQYRRLICTLKYISLVD